MSLSNIFNDCSNQWSNSTTQNLSYLQLCFLLHADTKINIEIHTLNAYVYLPVPWYGWPIYVWIILTADCYLLICSLLRYIDSLTVMPSTIAVITMSLFLMRLSHAIMMDFGARVNAPWSTLSQLTFRIRIVRIVLVLEKLSSGPWKVKLKVMPHNFSKTVSYQLRTILARKIYPKKLSFTSHR